MNTQIKNTPGPWMAFNKVGNRILNNWKVMGEENGICTMDESLTGEERIANARLIAAAPELLETLREISKKATLYYENAKHAGCNHDMTNYAHIADVADKAIAKAEGR